MANNFKLEVKGTYSENSDYSDPEWISNLAAYEIDPDEAALNINIVAATGGTTIDTATMDLTDGAATTLVLKNTDASNYVQVAWTDISTTACVARVPAGGLLVVPMMDPSPAPVITANTAAVRCKVLIAQA